MSALTGKQEAPRAADEHGFAGTVYCWWREDTLPDLQPLPGLRVRRAETRELLDAQEGGTRLEIEAREWDGDVPYVACMDGEKAAWGWSAWRRAQIGELGIQFELPSPNHYLWDFATLPQMRGRGIYTHLLQEILKSEVGEAGRFWIGHEPGNTASARGILSAGFRPAGEIWFRSGRLVFVGDGERAEAGAALFQLPLLASVAG